MFETVIVKNRLNVYKVFKISAINVLQFLITYVQVSALYTSL